MNKLDKYVINLTYAYLVLPVILFALGWLKLPLAIMLTILLIYSSLKAAKDFERPSTDNYPPIKFRSLKILLALVIIFAIIYWVYLSGIGGFTYQNEDFELRNAMLRDLTNFSWPVEYKYPAQPDTYEMAGHQGALVYYFTYLLPAALFGKMFGWAGANFFLFVWTVLGIMLCFYWLSRNFKRISALLLLLFIFWSGLDAAGWVVRGNPFSIGTHLEWWAGVFQYSSNTTGLFWVFNQVVVPWIIVMLLFNQINKKKQVFFTYALCLPYGPFPFIGLAPFVAYYLLSGPNARKIFSRKRIIDFKALGHNLKSAFSVSNLLTAPLIIGVFFLFFRNPGSLFGIEFLWKPWFNFKEAFKDLHFVYTYFLFCLLEFGIYAFLIQGKFKKDPVFWLMVLSLLIIPSFSMGINNDFVMRASIPALTFLMIYVAKFLAAPSQRSLKYLILKFSLIGFLLIGAITPFNEICRSMTETGRNPRGIIRDQWHTLSTLGEYKYGLGFFVVKDPQDTLFFKYLGNHHDFTKPPLSQGQAFNKRSRGRR